MNRSVLRAGIVGTGFMGAAHAEALRRVPGVDIAAVASRRPERARSLAEQYGISSVFERWEDLVASDDVDVVHNCTPNDRHFEINTAALKAGKHVVSEKPLTTEASEAEKLVALANELGLVGAVNFNYRGYPLIQHARALVEKGDIGRVHLVHGHYAQDWLLHADDFNWRVDARAGGPSRAFADIGSHWCDLVQFITGQRISAVMADLFTVHAQRSAPRQEVETFQHASGPGEEVAVETEDGANVLFELENGARGAVTISQVSAGRKNHQWFEIDGAKAALSWNQERPNELWIGHRNRPNEVLIKDPSLLDPAAQPYAHYPGGHPEGYPDGPKNLFANVYRAVRDGSSRGPGSVRSDFPTFADGLRAAHLVDAVLESHRRRAWVDVPPTS